MDENPEDQLEEKIIHCLETDEDLEEEYISLRHYLRRSPCSPIFDDENGQLILDTRNRIDRALQLIQQQLKLAFEEYLHTQSALPTSVDRSTIQSDDNHQIQGSNVTNYNTINQQVVLSDDNNGQIEAKLNPAVPEPQAHFNGTLPDDFYLHLISVMGIQECLLSNRLVCSLWNELVLERFHNQKSLKLFETFDRLMKYGEYLLDYEKMEDPSLILKPFGDYLLFEQLGTDHMQLVKSLDPEVILTREKKQEASKVLTTNFPKVEQLVLCAEYDTLINIEHLLQFYAKQLTSLSLTEFSEWNESAGKLRAFSFPLLKTLNTFNFSPEDDQLLSLLPQLESLTLPRSLVISLETLLRTGTQLRELNIKYIKSVYTVPVDEFSKRPRINTNLRKFIFYCSERELQALEFISLNLTSLEGLKLCFGCDRENMPLLHSVISYLVPLHQLDSLTLKAPVSFFLLDDNQFANIQPLPSVRHLKLLLSGYDSLSMDLFSRAIFAAFPNVEQVLISFVGNYHNYNYVDSDTITAFEAFAENHPNVVQLFRSKNMSKFTNLPNIVAPLLGHYRQVYEECLEEEELFGVAICKLSASLVTGQGEDRPNLKITLRPADRLTALSNLHQLLESKAFTFLNFFTESNFSMVHSMLWHMVKYALKYGPSESALFTVTCKCVLIFIDCTLDCSEFKKFALSNSFGDAFDFFKHTLQLMEHYQKQQFKDEDLLLLIHNSMDKLIKEMLEFDDLHGLISEFIQSENRVHRVEAVHAFLRFCENIENVSKLLPSY